jgi:hypothetical protein
MKERYTQRVRRILELAASEAGSRRHAAIDTNHLLLALLRQGSGAACDVLRSCGVDVSALAAKVSERLKPGPWASREAVPFGDDASQALAMAEVEAQTLGHSYLGSEHVLLGLLREARGLAAVALASTRLELDQARRLVLAILGSLPGEEASLAARTRAHKLGLEYRKRGPRKKPLRVDRSDESARARILLGGSRAPLMDDWVLGLMPGGEAAQHVWADGVEPAIRTHGRRSWCIQGRLSSSKMLPIAWSAIRASQLLIADIGESDPGVMLYVGMALAASRWPVFIARVDAELPGELAQLNVLRYAGDEEGLELLREELGSILSRRLGEDIEPDGDDEESAEA